MGDRYQKQDEDDLPPKPPITDPMPSDEDLSNEPEPGDEDVPDEDFMSPDEARDNDTVDDQEQDLK
jgi:hypothetical protein